MPIFKAKNYLDVYRVRAASDDLHQMSGRHDKRITAFCNQQMEREMAPSKDDVVVDIGCGDGSFLVQIHKNIATGFGIVPTEEEKARLEVAYSIDNLSFLRGLTTKLPLADETASKVICNGVLVLLDTEDELVASMREIYRVSKKHAMIWIGELPHVDEFAYHNKKYGDSLIKWVMSELRQNGVVAAANATKKVLTALFSKETLIINPKTHLYILPDKFVQICENIGFEVLQSWKSITIDKTGRECEIPTRYNYLLRKTLEN